MNRFDELSARYYENDINEDSARELHQMLETNPELLRSFVIMGVREEQLITALRSSSALEKSHQFKSAKKKSGKRTKGWVVAAAVIAITFAVTFFVTTGVEVEVMASQDVKITKGNLITEVGCSGRVREISISSGLLSLRMRNDICIDLLAPAKLRFISPMHVQILSGKVTVDVGEHGKGFILDAPQTCIVDLGTRFGVDATSKESTSVVVIEGSVELHSKEGKVNHLAEGEGAIVNTSGTIGKLDHARFNPRSGQWSAGALDDGGNLIRSVKNNQKDQSVYHIVAGGLVESVPAHHNRNARWVSLPEKPIPSWLIGADLVLPAHTHRNRKNLHVSMTVAPKTTIFIFQRRTQTPPQWLIDGFIPTGEMIGKVSIEKNKENKPVSFEIWRRDVPLGGEVHLGPAARPDSFHSSTILYGIAALPTEEVPAHNQ